MQQRVGGIVTNNIFKPCALAAVQKVQKTLSAFRKAFFSLSQFLQSSQKSIIFLTLLAFKITKLKYKIFPCHSLDFCSSSLIFQQFKESEKHHQSQPANPNKHDIVAFIWLQIQACIYPHSGENQELPSLETLNNNEMCEDSTGRHRRLRN